MAKIKRPKKQAKQVVVRQLEFTPAMARLLIEAHDMDIDAEEIALVQQHNPELADAYEALSQFALKP